MTETVFPQRYHIRGVCDKLLIAECEIRFTNASRTKIPGAVLPDSRVLLIASTKGANSQSELVSRPASKQVCPPDSELSVF